MSRKLKTLELFGGSCSFSRVAEKREHEIYTTDSETFDWIEEETDMYIDQVCDIFDFNICKIPYKPEIIWASPPCTSFSIAAVRHHWIDSKTPRSDKAVLGLKIVEKTIEIIQSIKPKYWFIENPRGLLRKQDIMQDLPRKTVTYCKYGDMRMKPTDIWTNCEFQERPMCSPGNRECHHEPAPRGSQAGTQGLANDYERSKIPAELFEDIFDYIENESST